MIRSKAIITEIGVYVSKFRLSNGAVVEAWYDQSVQMYRIGDVVNISIRWSETFGKHLVKKIN